MDLLRPTASGGTVGSLSCKGLARGLESNGGLASGLLSACHGRLVFEFWTFGVDYIDDFFFLRKKSFFSIARVASFFSLQVSLRKFHFASFTSQVSLRRFRNAGFAMQVSSNLLLILQLYINWPEPCRSSQVK